MQQHLVTVTNEALTYPAVLLSCSSSNSPLSRCFMSAYRLCPHYLSSNHQHSGNKELRLYAFHRDVNRKTLQRSGLFKHWKGSVLAGSSITNGGDCEAMRWWKELTAWHDLAFSGSSNSKPSLTERITCIWWHKQASMAYFAQCLSGSYLWFSYLTMWGIYFPLSTSLFY